MSWIRNKLGLSQFTPLSPNPTFTILLLRTQDDFIRQGEMSWTQKSSQAYKIICVQK